MLLTVLSFTTPLLLAASSILVGVRIGARKGFYEGYKIGFSEGVKRANAEKAEVV